MVDGKPAYAAFSEEDVRVVVQEVIIAADKSRLNMRNFISYRFCDKSNFATP